MRNFIARKNVFDPPRAFTRSARSRSLSYGHFLKRNTPREGPVPRRYRGFLLNRPREEHYPSTSGSRLVIPHKTYDRKDSTGAALPPLQAGYPRPCFVFPSDELWRRRDRSGRSDRRNHRLRGWAIRPARGDPIAGPRGADVRRPWKYGSECKRALQRGAGRRLFEHDSGEDERAGDGILHMDRRQSGGAAAGDGLRSDEFRRRGRLFRSGNRF